MPTVIEINSSMRDGDFYSHVCESNNDHLFNYTDYIIKAFYFKLREIENVLTKRLSYIAHEVEFKNSIETINYMLTSFKTEHNLNFDCSYTYDYGDMPRTYLLSIRLNNSLAVSMRIDTRT